jgi:hypothetical protein
MSIAKREPPKPPARAICPDQSGGRGSSLGSFFAAGAIVTSAAPAARNHDSGLPAVVWPFQVYNRFDSGWFLRISAHGYFPQAGRSPVTPAFLPGYPLAARYVATVLGLGTPTTSDYITALALLSLLGSAISAVCCGS